MYYLLSYEVVDDYLVKREPYRKQHIELATAAVERGELLLGGAITDNRPGAMLLFEGNSKEVAEQFALMDPYVSNNLVKAWHVCEWNIVVGKGVAEITS